MSEFLPLPPKCNDEAYNEKNTFNGIDNILEITEKYFYNTAVLKEASCIIDKTNENFYLIEKTSKNIEFVQYISKLREKIFNFIYIYDINDDVIFTEKSRNFMRFDDFLKDCSFKEFFMYYIQILMALEEANRFSHGNLLAKNIDIRYVYDGEFQLYYKKNGYIITNGAIATINKYENSSIELNFDELKDAYDLLDDSLLILKEYNHDVYEDIKKIEDKNTLSEFIKYCIEFSNIEVSNKPFQKVKLLSSKTNLPKSLIINYNNIYYEFMEINDKLNIFVIFVLRPEIIVSEFEIIKTNFDIAINFLNAYKKLIKCNKNINNLEKNRILDFTPSSISFMKSNLNESNLEINNLKFSINNRIEYLENFHKDLISILIRNSSIIKENKLKLTDEQKNFYYKNYNIAKYI